jgi:hypothetical protein
MSDLTKELMKSKAAPRKDPEFYEAQQELAYKLEWAKRMVDADRLTKAEFQEFESHLAAEYLAALPVEQFVEMQKDGSYADIETIAGHDGTRDRHDVLKDRAALNKKITQDALDEALASNKIDAKRYNEEHRKVGTFDDDMTRRVTDADVDGDHDSVAMDSLLGRLAPDEPASPPPSEDRIKSADED